MINESRRGFMGKAFGAVAAVGAVGSLVAMKKTWDPLPSVMAAGFTTVDMSKLAENKLEVVKWQGKPIFLLKFAAYACSGKKKRKSGRSLLFGYDRSLYPPRLYPCICTKQ